MSVQGTCLTCGSEVEAPGEFLCPGCSAKATSVRLIDEQPDASLPAVLGPAEPALPPPVDQVPASLPDSALPLFHCPADGAPLVANNQPVCPGAGCPSCGGIWVSPAALETLGEIAALPRNLREFAEARRRRPVPASDLEYKPIQCPQCREFMMRRQFARRSGVVVEVCSRHGTWFAPGKLDLLLDFIRSGGLIEQFLLEGGGAVVESLRVLARRLHESHLRGTGGR
jgi:Zn-finger nucleic acid-binding protein